MSKKFPGTLFLVVGNSGSGKDSIISGIIEAYPPYLKQIYAPKRFITRPPSNSENNVSITPEEFKKMDKKGEFAFKWQIYGLSYGIPIKIEDFLKKGHPVIINVSRSIVQKTREIYKNLKVVFIYVPLETTIKRLKDRGRERSELLEERIERAKTYQLFQEADIIIDNSGKLDSAINQCLKYIISVVSENQKR